MRDAAADGEAVAEAAATEFAGGLTATTGDNFCSQLAVLRSKVGGAPPRPARRTERQRVAVAAEPGVPAAVCSSVGPSISADSRRATGRPGQRWDDIVPEAGMPGTLALMNASKSGNHRLLRLLMAYPAYVGDPPAHIRYRRMCLRRLPHDTYPCVFVDQIGRVTGA